MSNSTKEQEYVGWFTATRGKEVHEFMTQAYFVGVYATATITREDGTKHFQQFGFDDIDQCNNSFKDATPGLIEEGFTVESTNRTWRPE